MKLDFGYSDSFDDHYLKQDALVNNYPFWVSSSGNYSVWHFATNEWYGWMEGHISKLGTDEGYSWVPSNASCIEDIEVPWWYPNQTHWIQDSGYLDLTCYTEGNYSDQNKFYSV